MVKRSPMMNQQYDADQVKQMECEHKTLRFGSGDYYVTCKDCGRTWVKAGPASDEPDPLFINENITGEERHELTIERVKVVIEGE